MSAKLITGLCSGILLTLIVLCLAAPVFTSQSRSAIDLPGRLQPPGPGHWLGTDELGRDVWSRLLYGGRISFLVSAVVVSISLGMGTILGTASGFRGGLPDELMMRAADVLLAFPGILLAIALMAVLGPSLQNVIIALVSFGWIPYARMARGLTMKLREMDFVLASRSLGASHLRTIFLHILPNILPALVVQASFGFAAAVLAESSLSFLGLGVQPPEPSWGNMLSDGKNHLLDSPHLTLFPGFMIFLTVLCWNLLGDALRDSMDPRFQH